MRHATRQVLTTVVLAAGGFTGATAGPKAPATLVSEFSDLFNGRTARIVWQKDAEGWPGLSSGNNAIMKLDTRDGNVTTLVSGTGYKARATFTWDGERVVYTVTTANAIYAAKWSDGTSTLIANGYHGGGCWFDDNKHWVLAVPSSGAGLWRINIDNPAEKVKIADEQTTWPSISVDGTHVTAQYPSFSNVGILTVATGGIVRFTAGEGSCWPTISRDNTYQTMYTVEPHSHFVIVGPTGTVIKNQEVKQASSGEYNCLRWTMDPDIFTFFHDGENLPNPYVERVSDGKYVYINDPATGSEGNCDVFFPSSTQAVRSPQCMAGTRDAGPAVLSGTFDHRGRSLPGARRAAGVCVKTSAGGRSVRVVLMR